MIRARDFFFVIALLEVVIGGGGRLVEIGPITLRMLIFILSLVIVAIDLVKWLASKNSEIISIRNIYIMIFMMFFVVVLFISTITGLFFDANTIDMLEDIKPRIYFFELLYFSAAIVGYRRVNLAVNIFKFGSLLLAISYIVVQILQLLGVVDAFSVYNALSDSGEFIYRTDSNFVFKGFIFLGIGILFYLANFSIFNIFAALLIFIAIVLTFTRGFLISTILTTFIFLIITKKTKLLYFLIPPVVISGAYAYFVLPTYFEDFQYRQEVSTNVRLEDFDYFINNISIDSLVFGHGYGALIAGRNMIENSFLYIIWKEGLLGLVFWVFPLFVTLKIYLSIPQSNGTKSIAASFLLGSFYVYLQSLFNPYVTNPIGIAMLSISFVSLCALKYGCNYRPSNAYS